MLEKWNDYLTDTSFEEIFVKLLNKGYINPLTVIETLITKKITKKDI